MARKPRKQKTANVEPTTEEVVIGNYKFDQPVDSEEKEEIVEYVETQPPLDDDGNFVVGAKAPAVVKYVKVDPDKLVIRVDEKGNPIGHPIFYQNMKDISNNFNYDKLPAGFEYFKRIPFPELEVTQMLVKTEYVKKDGVWQDEYTVRDLTPEEILNKHITLPQGV
jgi:hypothetical protein